MASAIDFGHTSLVQQTRNYKPLVTLVNQIARGLLPKWFTWTTMQFSCNVLTNRITTCMTHPLGRQCSPQDSTHGGTYGWREVVCVVVKVDGDAIFNVWMALHGMVQHMMYHSNRLWYVWVHCMPLVHGMGRGGLGCYTVVVTGGHSHHGTMHSSTRLQPAHMQVHSGPLGGAPRRSWGIENPPGYNWCWLGTTLQCLLVVSGGHGGQHPQCLDDGGVWGILWQDVLAHVGSGVYNPQAIAERLAR